MNRVNTECPGTELGAFIVVIHSVNTVVHSFTRFKGLIHFPWVFLI